MHAGVLTSLAAALVFALPAAAQTWFLPDVFPNHHLASTHKVAGIETIGDSGRAVYWLATLESNYWSTGNWTRSLTYANEQPCCWDLNQWHADGDRGRGGYFGRPDADTYETWIGRQEVPTFPISVDEATLPREWIVPPGTTMGMRVHRPTDSVIGYLDAHRECCQPAPVTIAGRAVLIRFSVLPGRLKLEGWGVDANGTRVTGGEAFYFCRGCLLGPDGVATGGPLRWELTDASGTVTQQWTFDRWVPRTAQDVNDTTRQEFDRLRKTVKDLEAAVVALEPCQDEQP